ncbi:MAG TPA: efflux RND transporter periplasmic adaptor subunit [Capillibacterium sp.]
MRKFFVVVIILIVIATAGYLLTGNRKEQKPALSGSSLGREEAAARPAVEVAPAEAGVLQETLALSVIFKPASTVPVIPQTGGTVTQVFVATGDRVAKGQILFTIDDRQLQLQVKQAEAAYEMACANLAQVRKGATAEELKQLEAAVLQARASYENAAAEYQRVKELFAQGMIAQQQLEAITLQKEIAANNLTAAEARLTAAEKGASPEQLAVLEAQVKQAESALEMAKLQLSYTRVTAPISGVLAQFNVEVGSMAAPAVTAGVVLDQREMKATAYVPESYVNGLRVGDQVPIEVKAVPGVNFTGTITAITPMADQTTRQFPVELAVTNTSDLLKAGMIGTAHLTVGTARTQVIVPATAVLYDGEQAYVYVVADGYAVRREIITGLSTADRVAVEQGLSAGEQVIIRGQHQVENGMLVEVK